ncbi:MAG: Galactose-1-phosphate uridylyltransferase [Candidatus Berkelbacteria bacterium Athens1014_28]|uniref:Galactose-1-phosphate uridylyltransferase n=1 Tax=Candidatus Berkelbacteria bacterium Athens1014_28 TaxID=2017145 RepID=A0A554LK98_9BACT|nr:MAG: Galactose-1-phosphate uridylyltransferase [Candidatus Berkelbacteria bacterium Athens1014_28]
MSLIKINKKITQNGFISPVLRQNIITGDWIVIAPGRARRPDDFIHPELPAVKSKKECPFCAGSKGYKENEIISSKKDLYVIENKFPAFYEKNTGTRSYYPEESFYRERSSIGHHEVVIIKDHNQLLTSFSKSLTFALFSTILERYNEIKKDDQVSSITPIYNHGPEAGASIEHPHAQIFASSVVANTVNREMDGAERYFGINGVCVYCDIIRHERAEKKRVVYQNDKFLAYAPFASRFPFEVWITPKTHKSQFENSNQAEIEEFSDATVEVLGRLEKIIPNIPLNLYIRTLPTTLEDCGYYHWYLEIAPRLTLFGGFELGSGVIINIIPPEKTAEYLRK